MQLAPRRPVFRQRHDRGDGFAVSSDGVALGNAGAGERVNIRVANGKVVSALVEPDGAVSIQLQ